MIISLPDTVTADPRWQGLADTGIVEVRWQGEELVLRGITQRELLRQNHDVSGANGSGMLRKLYPLSKSAVLESSFALVWFQSYPRWLLPCV